MQEEQYVQEIYARHGDALYRLCYFYTGNVEDASDMVQNTLIKLWEYDGIFESEEHEKAWLYKVGANECRQLHRHWWHKRVTLNEIPEYAQQQQIYEGNNILAEVFSLSAKYRVPIYMHYYEGYSTAEIGAILKLKEATVRSRLLRGRNLLKEILLREREA